MPRAPALHLNPGINKPAYVKNVPLPVRAGSGTAPIAKRVVTIFRRSLGFVGTVSTPGKADNCLVGNWLFQNESFPRIASTQIASN